MHSGGYELTKLTYTRLEDNLIRHRGDRWYTRYQVPGIYPSTRRVYTLGMEKFYQSRILGNELLIAPMLIENAKVSNCTNMCL